VAVGAAAVVVKAADDSEPGSEEDELEASDSDLDFFSFDFLA
jgi:hypothetical protein